MKGKKHVTRVITSIILAFCVILAPMSAISSYAAISSQPAAGQSNTYSGTGGRQSFTAPASGYYTIECGGGASYRYGSRTRGMILLKKGDTLYLYVANGKKNGTSSEGGDGGQITVYEGSAHYAGDGAAATEVRLNADNQGARIMVAGGGCGSGYRQSEGSEYGAHSEAKSNGDGSGKGSKGYGNGGQNANYACVAIGAGGGGYYGGERGYSGTSYIGSGFSSTSQEVGVSSHGYVTITYVRPYYEYSLNPQTQTVKEYSSFSLGVETTETPASYQWQFSANGGSSWNNITENIVYQGQNTKTLHINKIPYDYNGYLYRCSTVFDGKTYYSSSAVLTVESGLVFDSQPQNTSRIEEQEIILSATSAYADAYGKYQWQIKEPGGVWIDLADTDKYTGIHTSNLMWECVLDDNNAIYRCVISTQDGTRVMESDPATVTVIKKDFNKILAQYNQKIEYGDSLDINGVYVSVQYTNGKVDFASGWKNLFYLIDGKRERVFIPDQLGTQTLSVVFIDDTNPEEEKEYEAKLNVTVVDTTAPSITKCDVSEHEVGNDPSVTQTITVAAEANDLCTAQDRLLYALVDASRVPIASDWVRVGDSYEAVFRLTLNQNKEYILYVKDENDNIAKQDVSVMVLDVTAPSIDAVYLLMTEREWYSYNILKIDASDNYFPEEIQYRIALSEEELLSAEWSSKNEFYIDQNGTYIVEVKDSVGNKARGTYKVANIDATPPSVEGTIEYDYETDSFTLSATISDDGSGLYSYQKMNAPLVYLGEDTKPGVAYQVDFAPVGYDDFKNAIVLEVTDKAGNTNFYSFIKNEDDYSVPTVILTRMTEETGEWLDHVIIKATYSLERGTLTSKPYSFVKWDGNTAPSSAEKWTNNSTYSVTSSGKYRCFVKTMSGTVGYADIIIGDVDANPPEIAFEAMNWDWKNKCATLHYTVTDTDSGLDKITIQTNSLEGNRTYGEYYGMASAEIEAEVTLYANAIYSLYAYDIAGHESTYKISCNSKGQLVRDSVTVMFLDYDDTLIGTQIITRGENAVAPEEPVRNGYVFKGWDASLINIQEDVTIKAIYVTALSSTYTVTFKDYNGAVLKTQTVEAGQAATPPIDPERNGYTFSGWNNSYTNVTTDVICTAVYQSKNESGNNSGKKSDKEDDDGDNDDKTYTVIFKDYDGIVLKTQTVQKGRDAFAPEEPQRDGYVFRGWNDSYRNVTEDTVCTAVYEKNSSEGEGSPVSQKTGATANVNKNKGGFNGNGSIQTSSDENNLEEFNQFEQEEVEYISVAMMQIRASELAVDNEEYGELTQNANDEESVEIESDTHMEDVTQKQGEQEKKSVLGFWLVVSGLIGLAGFTIFYNLNRKHMWVKLPDIPVLNFDFPFSS